MLSVDVDILAAYNTHVYPLGFSPGSFCYIRVLKFPYLWM